MSIVTTARDQRYLILLVLPTNLTLPFNGLSGTDLVSSVQEKVSGINKAGQFWEEVSYGNTSFIFDVNEEILNLPESTEYYYRNKRAKTIDGSSATFPVTWTGSEMLKIIGNEGFEVIINFPAQSMSLEGCIDEINEAILEASPDPGDPKIIASTIEGQIHLRTLLESDDATLEVSGSALGNLGLDLTNRTVNEGFSLSTRRKTLVQHALENRISGLANNEVENTIGNYDGIIAAIVGKDGDIRAGASLGSEEFQLGDENYEFSWIAITTDDPWKVFAHEIGHNLGFPDLYQGNTDLIGLEPGSWDIMGSSSASHPTGWIKTFKTNNQWEVNFEIMKPPSGPDPKSFEVLLSPSEVPLPITNPFAGSHPDLPLTHIVRLDIEGYERNRNYQMGNRALYVENRVKLGTYSAPFADSQFDKDLPGSGIIITDAINTYTGVLVNRSEVRMAEPDSGPISNIGDVVTVQRFGIHSSINVEILDIVQNSPPVYHLRITWGPAERFDYRIEPWNPPPWESPDVWIDTNFANDWNEYKNADSSVNPDVPGNPIHNGDESRVGWKSRVYARVHNDGNTDRTNVPVRFEVVIPATIGPAPGQLIGETRIDIPKRSSELAQVEWTPRSHNEKHVCLRVTIDPDRDELSELNNEAQENLTEWYAEASSPYKPITIRYQVVNPLKERSLIRLRAKGLTRGWSLEVEPYEFWLEAGEILESVAFLRADNRVPYDDVLVKEKISIPVVSLEGLILEGHAWVPFGGFSGVAHAVRKTKLEVDIELKDSQEIIVFGHATSLTDPKGKAMNGATVGLRIFSLNGKNLNSARAKVDAEGNFMMNMKLPAFLDRNSIFALDAVLSPILGFGPAEAEIIRFTIDKLIDVVPRNLFGLSE